MGFIIGIIERFIGVRKFIAGLLTTMQVALYVSIAIFIVSLVNMLLTLYNLVKELFSTVSANGGASLAGSDGVNDFSAIAWSMLHAFGISDVFQTFFPLFFSTFTAYFSIIATRMLLDFQKQILAQLQKAANLYLG